MEGDKLKKDMTAFLNSKAVLLAGLLLFLVLVLMFREPIAHVLDRLRLIEFRDFRAYFGV